MTDRVFFDTNILVYFHDTREPDKQRVAEQLLRTHLADRRLVLSTQVLQEFFVTVTQKLRAVPAAQAKALISDYSKTHVVTVNPGHILDAIDLQERYQLSFWDGLILAAAKSAGAAVLCSEDFAHGEAYDGVRVENPFR
jgi:predicted nucleic acid-binding protein